MNVPVRFLPVILALFPALALPAAELRPPLPQPQFSWTGAATNAAGQKIAQIRVDTAETPDLAEWGRRAGELCAAWYGRLAALLPSAGFQPAAEVTLIFRADMDGVAATGGNNIFIAAKFVRAHPDDVGMVIHELVHVVQAYPPGGPGWLVEGIADYVRLAHFEPQAPRPRLDPRQARYTDAYKTTAVFLEWLTNRGHPRLVEQLNAALRQQRYRPELFTELAGRSVEAGWAEFVRTLPEP